MLPPARVVLEDPLLYRVSFDLEARRPVATADKLTVNLPFTVATFEPERASDTRRVIRVRESVEVCPRRNQCRVHAVVGYWRAINNDLEDLVSLPSAQDIPSRTASVFLFQTVLEEERLARIVGEIDYYIDALCY